MSTLYAVQPGDTLDEIASWYGTSVKKLAQVNNIYYPYSIYDGQILNIPETADAAIPSIYSLAGWESVENIIGKKGTLIDGVLKFTFPRYNLKVSVGNVTIEPEFALTPWMAFHRAGNLGMVMGDLALLQKEIDPVITQLIEHNFEITALHNHLLYELPRIMYLHFSGIGDINNLAEVMKKVLSVTQIPLKGHSVSKSLPEGYWNKVEKIMGKKGNPTAGVLQFSFPRANVISEFGNEIPSSMGVSHSVNFQALGSKAAVTGDFVLIAEEVYRVIRQLKQNGITITAVHNHMLYETPRLFFLHFWAVGNPEKLAYGLKDALSQTNTINY